MPESRDGKFANARPVEVRLPKCGDPERVDYRSLRDSVVPILGYSRGNAGQFLPLSPRLCGGEGQGVRGLFAGELKNPSPLASLPFKARGAGSKQNRNY